jgi:hypothetical protein
MFNREDLIRLLTEHYPLSVHVPKIRAIYLYGSRLYGTANSTTSDYDFLIVHDDFFFKDTEKVNINAKDVFYERDVDIHFNNDQGVEIECHIFDTSMFVQLMFKHNAVVTQNTFISDPLFVWLEDLPIKQVRTYWFSQLNLQRRKIRSSLIREAEIWCFAKAKRLWHEGDIPKSKKNIVHAVRYLLFAHQLVKHGRIVDYTEANSWYREMLDPDNQFDTWKLYEDKYKPILNKLRDELSDYVKEQEQIQTQDTLYKHGEIKQAFEQGHYAIKTLRYIKEHGLSSLSKMFSVHITPLDSNDENATIVKLSRDLDMDRFDSSVIRECNGMVIDRTRNQLLCFPFIKFLSFDETGADQLDLDTITVQMMPNGIACNMYWYNGKWNISHDNDEKEWIDGICNVPFDSVTSKFWNEWNKCEMEVPSEDYINICFMFVLVEKDNSIVLCGARDLTTAIAVSPAVYAYKLRNWKCVAEFPFSFEQNNKKNNYENEMKRLQQEITTSVDIIEYKGVVCRDQHFRRVRVYLPVYTLTKQLKVWGICLANGGKPYQSLSSANNDTSILTILRMYASAEQQEAAEQVIKKLNPLFTEIFQTMRQDYNEMCDFIDQWWKDNVIVGDSERKWNDTKEFATFVKKHFPMDQNVIIFLMRRLNLDSREAFAVTVKGIDIKVLHQMWKQFSTEIKIKT